MPRPRLPLNEIGIRAAYESGSSLPTIAHQLGVDRSRVTRVVKEAGLFVDQRGAHWAGKRSAA